MTKLTKTIFLALLSSTLFACSSSTPAEQNAVDQTESAETVDEVLDETPVTDEQDASMDKTTEGEDAMEDDVAAMLEGVWVNERDNSMVITFNKDGSVSDNVNYGDEQVTAYKVEANDDIVLYVVDTEVDYDVDLEDIFGTDTTEIIRRTTDRDRALNEDDLYYIDAQTLIFDEIAFQKQGA